MEFETSNVFKEPNKLFKQNLINKDCEKMEINSCRICFTAEKLKLLSLFTVKIDDETLAEMVISLSGIEVNIKELLLTKC